MQTVQTALGPATIVLYPDGRMHADYRQGLNFNRVRYVRASGNVRPNERYDAGLQVSDITLSREEWNVPYTASAREQFERMLCDLYRQVVTPEGLALAAWTQAAAHLERAEGEVRRLETDLLKARADVLQKQEALEHTRVQLAVTIDFPLPTASD